MKTFRWILSFLLIGVLFFFPYRILQFISLLYLLMLGASYAYSRIIAACLTVHRLEPVMRAHRFEPMEIVLTVGNSSPLPLPYVTVIDIRGPLFSRESGKFIIRLRSWEKKVLSYRIESQMRGEYLVGPVVLIGSDPLGMFPWRITRRETGRLIVYPEVLPVVKPIRTGLPAGNLRVENRVYEDVTRYRSLREYVPGDDVRRISWKASAKTGRLHSMEYLPALFSPMLILMNMNGEDFPLRFRSHWVERSAVTAASLVIQSVSLGQEVGLVASAALKGGETPAVARLSAAPGHATAIMEMLARMEPLPGSTDYTRLLATSGVVIPVGTRIEVITPRVSEPQLGFLREAKQKGWLIELFLVGGDSLTDGGLLGKEFPVFRISDYGSELIGQ